MFSDLTFDFETRSKMTRALDDAMLAAASCPWRGATHAAGTREKLARRITAAALRGERDPKQLKLTAIGIKKN